MGLPTNFQQIGRKFRNSVSILQKNLGKGGEILSKVSEVGTKMLDGAVDALPIIAANPAYGMAKAVLGTVGVAGKAAQSLGGAKNVDDVAGSLKEAYNGFIRIPGPGQEKTVDHSPPPQTAADANSF